MATYITMQNRKRVDEALVPLKNKIYHLNNAKEAIDVAWEKFLDASTKLGDAEKIGHTDPSFKAIEDKFRVKSGRATVIHGLQQEVSNSWDAVCKAIELGERILTEVTTTKQ